VPRRSTLTIGLITTMMLSGFPGLVFAESAPPESEALFAAARAAIAAGRTEKSEEVGFRVARQTFTEVPAAGAVLVGFDIGVGKFVDKETVYALRPLYLTAEGDSTVQDHGQFRDRRSAGGKSVKSKVLRVVRIRAREGYAVGGLTLRTGLNINGLSVTFMRIKGCELDPAKSYASDWVGDRSGGRETSIDGNGAPVVGVFGSADDEHVSALGLVFASQPARRVQIEALRPPALPKLVEPDAREKRAPAGAKPVDRLDTPLLTYRDASSHFTFVIPDGWCEMPDAELDQMHAFMKNRLGDLPVHYVGGIRQRFARAWSYPYVLIQVQPIPSKPLSYDDLESELASALPGALKQVTGALGDLAQNTSIGSAVVNREDNVLVIRMEMDVAGMGKVQGLSIGHLGANAIVSLHCYGLDRDFNRNLHAFTEMNKSFHFDQGHDFKPAPPTSFNAAAASGLAGAGVVIAFAGGLFFVRRRSGREQLPADLDSWRPSEATPGEVR
jgi:hypothetical protein